MFKEKLSNNTFLARSKVFKSPADGTYNAIYVPKNGMVEEVWLIKTTATSAGTGTGTVGFTGNGETADPDGFLDAAAAAVTTLGTVSSKSDTQPGSPGKWFSTKGGAITITSTKGTSVTPGTFIVMARISIIQ